MSFLAVDPGRDTGWAQFTPSRQLVACGLNDVRDLAITPRAVIIESPQVYRASMSEGDPNDLITLARRVGWYEEHFRKLGARVSVVLPSEWKGQAPKEVTERRARDLLSPGERVAVAAGMRDVAPSKRNNVWDAIALGQTAFEKKFWA